MTGDSRKPGTDFDFRSLPKIDLHHHLDGAVRTKTAFEFAKKHSIQLPADNPDELQNHVTVSPDCRSLTDFLNCFEVLYPVLQYPDVLEQVAYEICEDFSRENVIYAETRFAPLLMTNEGKSQKQMVEAVLKGLRRGEKDFDTEVNLILCLYRGHSETQNRKTLQLAQEHAETGVVGIDLAGDESKYSSVSNPELFRRARKNDLSVTIHAGEAGPSENISEALDAGAQRIGHGVRAIEDQQLMERLRDTKTPLEICLTSNLQTQAVESVENHPLKEFYRSEILVTINTDDPRISQTTITEEFEKVSSQYEFTSQDCIRMLKNSARAAFVSDDKQQMLLDTIENYSEEN